MSRRIEVSYEPTGEYWESLRAQGFALPRIPDKWNLPSVVFTPAGFRFDLASVPRVFWRVIAPFELGLAGPLIHDYLYRKQGLLPNGVRYSRKQADLTFFDQMEADGVSWFRRNVAYLGVRIGGYPAWKHWNGWLGVFDALIRKVTG